MITSMFRRHPRRRVVWILHHALSLAVAAVFLVPLIWVMAASLRQPGLPPPRTLEWVPSPLAWSNYRRIFELVPLARYTLNSLLVVSLAVPITLISASWAGLAMAHLSARLDGAHLLEIWAWVAMPLSRPPPLKNPLTYGWKNSRVRSVALIIASSIDASP